MHTYANVCKLMQICAYLCKEKCESIGDDGTNRSFNARGRGWELRCPASRSMSTTVRNYMLITEYKSPN